MSKCLWVQVSALYSFIYFICKEAMMHRKEKLFTAQKDTVASKQQVGSISPQKYGRAAFEGLTFTPSKLSENVLYREASSLKRVEEQAGRNRQFQTQNEILSEQVDFLRRQRDGISGSLNDIIAMYKGIISEMEGKNEAHIKHIQQQFRQEMQKHIAEKDQESRYFQAERELLQQRITQLEEEQVATKLELGETQARERSLSQALEQANSDRDKLVESLKAEQEKRQAQSEAAKEQQEELRRQHMHAEVEWKNQMNEKAHQHSQQLDALERTHKAEKERAEAQHQNAMEAKSKEVSELTKTFETEAARLNDIVQQKTEQAQRLTAQNGKEQAKILKMTREYETEINHLSHQKNRLLDEIELLGTDNENLTRNKVLITDELQRQNGSLRELLRESSFELEKCKNEFLDLAKENTMLLGRLKATEEETKTWRDSYYMAKNRGLGLE